MQPLSDKGVSPESDDLYIFWRDAGVHQYGPVPEGFVILGQEVVVLGLRCPTLDEAKAKAAWIAEPAKVSVWFGHSDDGPFDLLVTFRR